MTPLQHDPSAHVPWTRTTFTWVLMAMLPSQRRLGILLAVAPGLEPLHASIDS